MGYKDGGITFKEFLDMRQKEDKERTRNQLLDDYKEFKKKRKDADQRTMAEDGGIIMADVDEMEVGPKGKTALEESVEVEPVMEDVKPTGLEALKKTSKHLSLIHISEPTRPY